MNQPQPSRQPKANEQLVNELHAILDKFYPEDPTMFMGLSFSKNYAVAKNIAKALSIIRQRDRKQIESQLVALLIAFQAGE